MTLANPPRSLISLALALWRIYEHNNASLAPTFCRAVRLKSSNYLQMDWC